MSRFLQISCYAITFVLAWYVGVFFAFLIPSEQDMITNALPGKPLPNLTLLFFKNPDIVAYLFFYPWLAFVGAPLFFAGSFWDNERFLLRLSAFCHLRFCCLFFRRPHSFGRLSESSQGCPIHRSGEHGLEKLSGTAFGYWLCSW